jgi:hypothetical protein
MAFSQISTSKIKEPQSLVIMPDSQFTDLTITASVHKKIRVRMRTVPAMRRAHAANCASDATGMFVMDEQRLAEQRSRIRRIIRAALSNDRNHHPSIFMWSIGNEEQMTGNNALVKIARKTLFR